MDQPTLTEKVASTEVATKEEEVVEEAIVMAIEKVEKVPGSRTPAPIQIMMIQLAIKTSCRTQKGKSCLTMTSSDMTKEQY